MEIGFLGLHHALIVYLLKPVELLLQTGIVVAAAGRGKRRQLAQVGILGVKGKDADAAVGIAVGPGVGHGGVVDGQHLQHPLSGGSHKVDHRREVAEVAHTEAALGTEREDGNEGACHALVGEGIERLVELVDRKPGGRGDGEMAVGAFFPDGGRRVVGDDDKLELEVGIGEQVGGYLCHPLVVSVLGHGYALLRVPLAEDAVGAGEHQPVARAQLRGSAYQSHAAVAGRMDGVYGMGMETLGKRRAVSIGVVGHVYPSAIDPHRGLRASRQVETMTDGGPLAPQRGAGMLDGEEIVGRVGSPCVGVPVEGPVGIVIGIHKMTVEGDAVGGIDNIDCYRFAGVNVILDVKDYVHERGSD